MTNQRARNHGNEGSLSQKGKGDGLGKGRIQADALLDHVRQDGHDEANQEDVSEEGGSNGDQHEGSRRAPLIPPGRWIGGHLVGARRVQEESRFVEGFHRR